MYIYISFSIYLKMMENVMMIDQDVTEVMGIEHDVNGIQ